MNEKINTALGYWRNKVSVGNFVDSCCQLKPHKQFFNLIVCHKQQYLGIVYANYCHNCFSRTLEISRLPSGKS
jgi:hypothetical protein